MGPHEKKIGQEAYADFLPKFMKNDEKAMSRFITSDLAHDSGGAAVSGQCVFAIFHQGTYRRVYLGVIKPVIA